MSETTRRIIYEGPAHFAGLLAQMLREEGVQVDYEPPLEERGAQEFARDVIVDLTASGMGAAIMLALQKFDQRMRGRATARIEEDDEDDD